MVPAIYLIRSRASLVVRQAVFFRVPRIFFMALLETSGGPPDRGLVRSPGRPSGRYRPCHLTPQDLAMPRCSAAPVRAIPSRSTRTTGIIRLRIPASHSDLKVLASSPMVDFFSFMDGAGPRDQ